MSRVPVVIILLALGAACAKHPSAPEVKGKGIRDGACPGER